MAEHNVGTFTYEEKIPGRVTKIHTVRRKQRSYYLVDENDNITEVRKFSLGTGAQLIKGKFKSYKVIAKKNLKFDVSAGLRGLSSTQLADLYLETTAPEPKVINKVLEDSLKKIYLASTQAELDAIWKDFYGGNWGAYLSRRNLEEEKKIKKAIGDRQAKWAKDRKDALAAEDLKRKEEADTRSNSTIQKNLLLEAEKKEKVRQENLRKLREQATIAVRSMGHPDDWTTITKIKIAKQLEVAIKEGGEGTSAREKREYLARLISAGNALQQSREDAGKAMLAAETVLKEAAELEKFRGGDVTTEDLVLSIIDSNVYHIYRTGQGYIYVPKSFKGNLKSWSKLSREQRFMMKFEAEGSPSGVLFNKNMTVEESLTISRLFNTGTLSQKKSGAAGYVKILDYGNMINIGKDSGKRGTVAIHETSHSVDNFLRRFASEKLTESLPHGVLGELELVLGLSKIGDIDAYKRYEEEGIRSLGAKLREAYGEEEVPEEYFSRSLTFLMQNPAKFRGIAPSTANWIIGQIRDDETLKVLVNGIVDAGDTSVTTVVKAMVQAGIDPDSVERSVLTVVINGKKVQIPQGDKRELGSNIIVNKDVARVVEEGFDALKETEEFTKAMNEALLVKRLEEEQGYKSVRLSESGPLADAELLVEELKGFRGGDITTEDLILSAIDKGVYNLYRTASGYIYVPKTFRGHLDSWRKLSKEKRFELKFKAEGNPSGHLFKKAMTPEESLMVSRLFTLGTSNEAKAGAFGYVKIKKGYNLINVDKDASTGPRGTVAIHETAHAIDNFLHRFVSNQLTESLPEELSGEIDLVLGLSVFSDIDGLDSMSKDQVLNAGWTLRKHYGELEVPEEYFTRCLTFLIQSPEKFKRIAPISAQWIIKQISGDILLRGLMYGLVSEGEATVSSVAKSLINIGVSEAEVEVAVVGIVSEGESQVTPVVRDTGEEVILTSDQAEIIEKGKDELKRIVKAEKELEEAEILLSEVIASSNMDTDEVITSISRDATFGLINETTGAMYYQNADRTWNNVVDKSITNVSNSEVMRWKVEGWVLGLSTSDMERLDSLKAVRTSKENAEQAAMEAQAAEREAARVESERVIAAARAKVEAAKVVVATRIERKKLADVEYAKVQSERKAAQEAARKAKEERIAAEKKRREAEQEAARLAEEKAQSLAKAKAARIKSLEKAEAAAKESKRLAVIEADRVAAVEADRLAAEKTARLAEEKAARLEDERLAAEEDERVAKEKADRLDERLEDEKLEADEAARVESEKEDAEKDAELAGEKVDSLKSKRTVVVEEKREAQEEADDLARDEAVLTADAEKARLAKEEADRVAVVEAERLDEIEKKRVTAERLAAVEAAKVNNLIIDESEYQSVGGQLSEISDELKDKTITDPEKLVAKLQALLSEVKKY